jgi:hypothetical protein
MTVKRALLVVAAALLFLSTLVVPQIANADGGGTGGQCGPNSASSCRP